MIVRTCVLWFAHRPYLLGTHIPRAPEIYLSLLAWWLFCSTYFDIFSVLFIYNWTQSYACSTEFIAIDQFHSFSYVLNLLSYTLRSDISLWDSSRPTLDRVAIQLSLVVAASSWLIFSYFFYSPKYPFSVFFFLIQKCGIQWNPDLL
jgi:hypothetical protein